MKIGEEKEINITFPEDYVENLAGKDVIFKVKLNSLTVDELPEADDEFAKDVSEFDTLAEYKEDLRKTVEKRHKDSADGAFHNAVMQQAVDNMTVVIPEVMIRSKEEEILRNYAANFGMNSNDMSFDDLCKTMGLDEETLNGSIRPGAEQQVKMDLLLDAVAKAENFSFSDEDVKAYVERVSGNMGVSAEELEKYFGREFIEGELSKEKATNVIFDSAVAVDAPAEEKAAEEAPAQEEKKDEAAE